MSDLTEQWNKGELPEGDYYIKRRNGYLPYDNIDSHGVWRNSIDEDIIEVLAPVPSYEEWQRIFHYASKYEYEYTSCAMDYENLKQENAELKDLLKLAKGLMNMTKDWACTAATENMIAKINKVLGGLEND